MSDSSQTHLKARKVTVRPFLVLHVNPLLDIESRYMVHSVDTAAGITEVDIDPFILRRVQPSEGIGSCVDIPLPYLRIQLDIIHAVLVIVVDRDAGIGPVVLHIPIRIQILCRIIDLCSYNLAGFGSAGCNRLLL